MIRRIAVVALGGLRRGAVASLARRDAEFAAAQGDQVTLVALGGREEPLSLPSGVRIVRVGGPLPKTARHLRRRAAGLSRLLELVAAAPAIGAVVRSHDVVVSHGGLEAALASTLPGRARTVFRMHNYQAGVAAAGRSYRRGERWLFAVADRVGVRRSNAVVAVSATLADQVARGAGRRPEVAINGLTPAATPDVDAPRDVDVLFVGRLVAEKGVRLLPDLAGVLREGETLVVAGQGVLGADLARTLAPSPRARLLGEVPAHQVPSLMARAKIVVVPSLDEPYGMVVVEALTAGACVVASAVGGIPEILADGEGGRLLPPGATAAWRAEVRRLLDDPTARKALVAAGRQHAARHDESKTLPALHGVYAG
ncbi:glycosyltransferase family 4 protein [Kineococcus radiotolerans]|uniref:Glycosyl transferase group 1 n=1 Tax=Kineococcus radiotolerans (strain ATCC BAA-149 / DSM 14245 / SRS30216) TaxID=266940 RepID=A6WEA6_KINRD|nr:glycosyltransferase family 4 protein [Kineococcus radiotolerans]ABS05145.1 glycosyl transferase group 1 [Kineococcus radiotolerans SRS30216 = ATCC BAA-149]